MLFVSQIPEAAIALIKKFEGFYANAYPDPLSGGKPITIGYGCTRRADGSDWELGDTITKAEAEQLLSLQLERDYLPKLEQIPGWDELNPNQQAALLSFAYNLGADFYGNLGFQSITALLQEKRWTDVDRVFGLYCNPGSSVEQGLRRRRGAEALLFSTPIEKLQMPSVRQLVITTGEGNYTYLKRQEGSAQALPDSEKARFGNGCVFAITAHESDRNHWLITLQDGVTADDGSGPYTQWRVFKDHCQISNSPIESIPPALKTVSTTAYPVTDSNSNDLNNQDVQQILIKLGLLDPPADGKWGRQSAAALQDFQRFAQLPQTGRLTPDTKAKLQSAQPFIALDDTYPSRIVNHMQQQGDFVAAGDRRFNILMIEGVDPDTGDLVPDRPNEFSDGRVIVEIPFAGVPRIVGAWEATCKAGYYYVDNPMNGSGTARCDRSQFKAWQLGQHGNRNPHEALVQVAPITIKRYRGRSDYYKETNGTPDEGLFGINFHWGYDYPKTDIGHASAGCLVGRTTEGHRNCMRIVKRDRRFEADNNYIFYITILSGEAIQ